MKKILIKKSFPVNKIGLLKAQSIVPVSDALAAYAVEKMKAASYVEEEAKPVKKTESKKTKKK